MEHQRVTLPLRPAPDYVASKMIGCDLYTGVQMMVYGRACAEAQREVDMVQFVRSIDIYYLHDSGASMTYAEAIAALEKENADLRAELQFIKSEGKK